MLESIDAVLIIVGSITFLVGAFSPISLKVFSESDRSKRLDTILGNRRSWRVNQLLYAVGPIVTSTGFGFAAVGFQDTRASLLAYLAFAATAIAAVLWAWNVYLRAVDPRAFAEGSHPVWLFAAYSVLTQGGLAAFGAALLRTAIASWAGWMLIGGSALFFAIYLIRRDLPPFIYYTLTLIAGLMLIRGG